MQPFLHNVFEDFVVWRHSKEQLEDDGTQGVDVALDGDLALLLVLILIEEVLHLMLGLVDLAVSLVSDFGELIAQRKLLR